ncbi:N-acetyltransferase [Leuconostoc litchii]|uniref:N-acetyltransferase n=1 Tax=Leuconostoc litchii TaxID=1981069 RepID=A0A6P2CMD0_9LACO|nr:GNAT family N-acetyltransferase [Leuconostoc litchii]TYC46077.1 N-acetyltransferase [Leuconostoc litchii]GMA69843.1 N-acetyltransferase [Leuconostoc litchii]
MIKIVDATKKDEQYWHDIYLNAFPAYERLPFSKLQQVVKEHEAVRMAMIIDDGQPTGILLLVEIPEEKVFVLYFAVDANIRGKGIGSRTISVLKEAYGKGIILESEIIGQQAENEDQRVKRYEFYQRNAVQDSGFITENMGGTFHLLRTTDIVSDVEYIQAISILGIEAKVEKRTK